MLIRYRSVKHTHSHSARRASGSIRIAKSWWAGLFAPVELLLTDNPTGATIQYVQPSSLMVISDNPPLLKAAQALDEKLSALISAVSGL